MKESNKYTTNLDITRKQIQNKFRHNKNYKQINSMRAIIFKQKEL